MNIKVKQLPSGCENGVLIMWIPDLYKATIHCRLQLLNKWQFKY